MDIASLMLGLVVGLGTNLVTGQVEHWWLPLRWLAAAAVWWLPGLVAVILVWEYRNRFIAARRTVWKAKESPYPGLEPYTEERSSVFFGRDREIQECLARLENLGTSIAGRQLLLVGPSGVGKSSFLQAGVIPRLSERWCVLGPLRAGADPFNGLAEVLAVAEDGRPAQILEWGRALRAEAEGLRAGLVQTPTALLACVRAARDNCPRVLIAVDQAEELLTPARSADGPLLWWYLQQLLHVDPAVRMVATLPTESLRHVSTGNESGSPTVFALGSMTTSQLREVIVRPAAAAGVGFDPGLVDWVVAEATVGDALPLLGHLMRQIWPEPGRQLITWRDYEQAGRVAGSIAEYADGVYNAMRAAHGAARVNKLLLRLVAWDGQRLNRRWIAMHELDDREVAAVRELQQARLVVDVDGGRALGLVHEALLRHWDVLVELGRTFTEQLRLRSHLESLADTWRRTGQAVDGLLRGVQIGEARRVAEALGASPQLLEFIAASEQNQRRDASRRAAAAAAWAQQIRLTDRANAVAIAHAAVTELDNSSSAPPLLTLWGLTARPQVAAEPVGHVSQISSLAWDGEQLVTAGDDGILCRWSADGQLLSFDHIESSEDLLLSPNGGVVAVISQQDKLALWTTKPVRRIGSRRIRKYGGGIERFGWTYDGRKHAYVDRSKLSLYESSELSDLPGLLTETSVPGSSTPFFSPDGKDLAVIDSKSASFGPALNYSPRMRLEAGEGEIICAAWSPTGEYFAVVTEAPLNVSKGLRRSSVLQAWRVSDGECVHRSRLSRIRGLRGVVAMTWSPESKQLVLHAQKEGGGSDLLFFSLGNDKPRGRVSLSNEQSSVWVPSRKVSTRSRQLAWNPTTGTIAVAQGKTLCFYQPQTKKFVQVAKVDLRKSVRSADWRAIAVGTREGARVYELDSRAVSEMAPAFRKELGTMEVRWSPDGRLLAATNFYGIAVWKREDGELLAKDRNVQEGSSRLAWSPDGSRLARLSCDWHSAKPGEVAIFDATAWCQLVRIKAPGTGLPVVVWSPDGKRLAVSDKNSGTRIIEADTGQLIAEHCDEGATCGDWSMDGTTIAIGTATGIVHLIDAEDGTSRAQCVGSAGSAQLVAWSPSGRILAAVMERATIQLWQACEGVPAAVLDLPADQLGLGGIRELSWEGEGSELRCATANGRVLRWKIPSDAGAVLAQLDQPVADLSEQIRQRFGLGGEQQRRLETEESTRSS